MNIPFIVLVALFVVIVVVAVKLIFDKAIDKTIARMDTQAKPPA